MGRSGGLTSRVLTLASAGRVLTLDAAASALFGESSTPDDRYRLRLAVNGLVHRQILTRAGYGAFKLAPTTAELDAEDQEAVLPVTPMTPAHRIAAYHAGRIMAMAQTYVAVVQEEVSDLYRDLGMAQSATPFEEPPTGFRVTRYASTTSETWRREG